ncbi:LPD38 domain-containing protein [Clostridium sp. AWRP]|uniref:LPD38 domain-containing protein n=1 Tax=Clostridium sp. AWRP TaxID=2212991 RepID=UPI000FDA1988|nr:LPD38 domain-containing protein [Clostridium sp. AWRP]AZV56086.1 hypothetical protein DMR38_05440 [Clostridium sp. AWRP]
MTLPDWKPIKKKKNEYDDTDSDGSSDFSSSSNGSDNVNLPDWKPIPTKNEDSNLGDLGDISNMWVDDPASTPGKTVSNYDAGTDNLKSSPGFFSKINDWLNNSALGRFGKNLDTSNNNSSLKDVTQGFSEQQDTPNPIKAISDTFSDIADKYKNDNVDTGIFTPITKAEDALRESNLYQNMANSPIGQFLSRVGEKAGQTATFNQGEGTDVKSADTGNNIANTVADWIGTGMGLAANPEGGLGSIGEGLEKAVGKPVENFISQPIRNAVANKLGKNSIDELSTPVYNALQYGLQANKTGLEWAGLTGAQDAVNSGNSNIQQPSSTDIAKDLFSSYLGGAIFGMAAKGLNEEVMPRVSNMFEKKRLNNEGFQEVSPDSGIWYKNNTEQQFVPDDPTGTVGHYEDVKTQPTIYYEQVPYRGQMIPKWTVQLKKIMDNSKNADETYDAMADFYNGIHKNTDNLLNTENPVNTQPGEEDTATMPGEDTDRLQNILQNIDNTETTDTTTMPQSTNIEPTVPQPIAPENKVPQPKYSDDFLNKRIQTLTDMSKNLIENNGGKVTPEIENKLNNISFELNKLLNMKNRNQANVDDTLNTPANNTPPQQDLIPNNNLNQQPQVENTTRTIPQAENTAENATEMVPQKEEVAKTPKENNISVEVPKQQINTPSIRPKTIESGQKYKLKNLGIVTIKDNDGKLITAKHKSGQDIKIGIKGFNNLNPQYLGNNVSSEQEVPVQEENNISQEVPVQEENNIQQEVQNSQEPAVQKVNDNVEKIKNDEIPDNIKKISTKLIGVDPQRFQFKEDTNSKTGASNELKGTNRFDHTKAGVVTVWQDKSGRNWVVNGHHRVELANRTKTPYVNAMVLKEKDGVTDKQAREIGALQNIGEGKGSAKDAAQVFRDGGYNLEDIRNLGLSTTDKFVKQSYNISKLNDRLWNKVVNKQIKDGQASMIGEAFPADNKKNIVNQNASMDYIQSEGHVSDQELKEVIDQIKAAPVTGQQMDMLGGSQFILKNNFKNKVKLISKVKSILGSEKSAFNNVLNKKKASLLNEKGNVLNDTANKKQLNLVKQGLELVDRGKNKAGDPINDILNQYAIKIEQGMSNVKAAEGASKEIVDLVDKSGYLNKLNNNQIEGQQSLLGGLSDEKQGQGATGNKTSGTGTGVQKNAGEANQQIQHQEELAKVTPEQEKKIQVLSERAEKLGHNKPEFSINKNGLVLVTTKSKSNNIMKHTIFKNGETGTGHFGDKKKVVPLEVKPNVSSMTKNQLFKAIDETPLFNKYKPSQNTVDWGNGKTKGQGKRIGNMVMGAMGDAPQGKKTYINLVGNVPEFQTNADDFKGMSELNKTNYLKAREYGLNHNQAMVYEIVKNNSHGLTDSQVMDRIKNYENISGVKNKEDNVSKKSTWLDTISKHDINYDKAYNAYRGISFDPERRAEEEQTSYVNSMKDIYIKMLKLAKTPEQKAVLESELNKYKDNYIRHMNTILDAKSRTLSSMITGPARFPKARNEKALNTEHKRITEFLNWQKKAESSIKKKITGAMSDDQKDEAEYERLKKEALNTIEVLKSIESGKEFYSPSLFRNGLRGKLMRSLNNGNVEIVSKVLDFIKKTEAEHLKKPVFSSTNGIWRAVESAKEKLTNVPEAKTGEETIKEYDGASIVRNFDADRVQIKFDEKPSEEVRKELKSTGWHFSPTNNVWQRKLTRNAEYSSKRILDKYFKDKVLETQTKKSTGTKAYIAPDRKTLNNGGTGETLPRKQIIDSLIKELDIPARVGRMNKRKASGIYKEEPQVIRTKLAEDIPTLSHEIGHHLDMLYRINDLVKSNSKFNKEVMNLGEEQAKLQKLNTEEQRSEGIAEFVRKYLTGEDLGNVTFTNMFEKILDGKLIKALNIFRKHYVEYQNADPGSRILSNVNFGDSRKTVKEKTQEKMKDIKNSTFDKFYTTWVDELRPLENLVKQGTPKSIQSDPFRMAWLFRGWSGKAIGAIKYGVYNYNANGRLIKVSKGLNEILKPIKADYMDNFRKYIIAKRVIEKEGQGIRTGFDLMDAEKVVETYGKNKEFVKAHEELQTYQDAILKRLVDGGLMSTEQYNKIKQLNKDYVPFYRILDNEEGANKYTGSTFGNIKSPVRKMRGSNASIVDPIESIVKNTYYFTNLSERNLVAQSLVKFAGENQGMGKFIENVTPKFSVTKFGLKEIKNQLEGAGFDIENSDLEKVVAVFRPIMKGNAAENIITVSFNGKPKLYQLDPDIYNAVMGLNRESSVLIFRIANIATKTLRAGAVLNPEFALRNLVRDAMDASVYSKYHFIPILDTIKGLSHVLKKDEVYQLWLNSGGAQSDFVSMDRDYLAKGVRSVLSKGKPLEILKDFLKNPLEPLRCISSLSEEATRLGHFSKGLNKEGNSREGISELGLSTRDLTLDFQRSGTAGKSANKVIAFFNATVQGQDKMIRTFRNPKTRTAALIKALIGITLPSLILWSMYHDDDKIKELPLWRKDLFWNIPTADHVISVPKPFELGIIFGSLPERALDYFKSNDPKAMKSWVSDFLENMLPGAIPAAVQPMFEWWANKSFFTGLPLENEGDKNLPAYQRYSASTSLLAKDLGKLASTFTEGGLSPKKIDNTIQGYTAGLGKYAVNAIDAILGAKNEKPAGPLEQIPGLKGFLVNPYSQPRIIDDFYSLKEDIDSKYEEAVKQFKAENPDMSDSDWRRALKNDITPIQNPAKEVISLPDGLSQLHNQQYEYNKASQYLSDVRKKEQAIYSDDSLSAAVKRGKINELQFEATQYIKQFNSTGSAGDVGSSNTQSNNTQSTGFGSGTSFFGNTKKKSTRKKSTGKSMQPAQFGQ